MNIAICDDEKCQRDLIEKLVREWADKEKIKVGIYLFESSEHFLFHWNEDKKIDVILLDIQMGTQNGVELARVIRGTDKGIQIIFVTGLTDYVTEGYEVEALHYLIKPIQKEKLFGCLDKAALKEEQSGNKIIFETKKGIVSLALRDIWYVEAFGHQCIAYKRDESYEIRESIGKLEAENGFDKEGFVKCHRSYLVNLKYIHKVEKDSIVLDDGRVIPISRNSYKNVVKAFISFFRRGT